MAEEATISRPYANAVFGMAKKADALDGWSSTLAELAAVAADPQVASRLSHPTMTEEAKAGLLKSLLGDDLGAEAQRFVDVLADNDRLELLPEIAAEFEALRAAEQQILDVRITSAFEVDDAMAQKLSAALARKFDAEISLAVTVDPALMGGAIIRAGDVVIDGSVRGRLTKMRDRLSQV